MKKTLSLLTVALLALFSYAAVTGVWKVGSDTPAAGASLIDDDAITVSTFYATTRVSTSVTINGQSFTNYIQVRVNALPSADNLTGTESAGSTPLVITPKEDLYLTVYYRRQKGTNGYDADDNKDLKLYDQSAPTTLISGTLTKGDDVDEKNSYAYKTYELSKGKTYTLCAKGTTIQFYGLTYEVKEEAVPTFVTLRNNPSFESNMGITTFYWNVAVRQQTSSGWVIKSLNSTSDIDVTITPSGVVAFDHVTESSNSGFNLVLRNVGIGTAQVKIKFKGGTFDGVKYAPSEATFQITVLADPYKWTYTATDQITYSSGYDPDPCEGKFEFTGYGAISGGEEITAVPGITLKVGAEGDNWSIVDGSNIDGGYSFGNGKYAVYCSTAANRNSCTSGCFYEFTPIVNGELTLNYYTNQRVHFYTQNNGTETAHEQWDATRIQTKNVLLKAGNVYKIAANNGGFWVNSFSFRPAYLAPTAYTSEQTSAFNATVSTTAYPQLQTSANENVMNWGTRSLVTVKNDGSVELVGSGSGMVGANIYRPGDESVWLTAKYDINTSVLNLSNVTPEENAVITALDNYQVIFEFDQNIALDNAVVILKIDADEAVTLDASDLTIDGKKLKVFVGSESIIQGATLNITIEPGSVKATSDGNLKNGKIAHSFSIDSSDPTVTMTYPENKTSASVGTAIAIQLDQNVDAKALVIGTLIADGEEAMTIQAYADGNKYIFKPTSTLKPNTTYTLVIPGNSMKVNGSELYVTRDKAFTFTTGAVSGTAPIVDDENSWPQQGEILASSSYDGGTITIAFDENVKLEPYTRIKATPTKGSEAGCTGEYNLSSNSLSVNSSNPKQLNFNYNKDELKWDVLYDLVIPANSVTGPGGMPNSEEIVVQFRMSKNPAARTLTQTDLPYMDGTKPFTWDFNKFGIHTTSSEDFATGVNDRNTTKWYETTQNNIKYYANYCTNSVIFPQGVEIQLSGSNPKYIDEFKGIRIDLVHNDRGSAQHRFRIKIPTTETKDDSYIYFVGNTHYITIPNVPTYTQYNINQVGKEVTKAPTRIYIKGQSHRKLNDTPDPDASGGRFTINSANAKFIQNIDERYGDQYAEIDEKKQKVYIVEMDPEGCAKWGNDLTFCISDFSIDKIAISTDSKTLITYGNGTSYATDCQPYNVAYSLTNDMGMGEITGMYICSSENSGVNSSSASVSSHNVKYAAGAEQGTIVKASSAGPFPYFTTDVNTWADELETQDAANSSIMTTNMLVGVLEATKLSRDIEGTNEMGYVFTGLRYITDDKGNFQYELAADDPDWNGDVDSDGYKLDENGNKIPKTKTSNSPTFQPVLASGQDSDGNDIDTGGLDTEKMWTLAANSSYLKLTKAESVNNHIYLDGIGENDLDGIENIAVNNGITMQANTYYTLQGVKVQGTPKQQGIYIYNNKKVLIK